MIIKIIGAVYDVINHFVLIKFWKYPLTKKNKHLTFWIIIDITLIFANSQNQQDDLLIVEILFLFKND
jgi:hypothetical protein